jgi:cytochrome c oxidase assembly protein subunit 11
MSENRQRKVEQGEGRVDRWLTAKLLGITVGMFGFGYLLVPLYDVFCEVTGFGGRTDNQAAVAPLVVDENREIEVEFIASVGASEGWSFRPSVSRMTIKPGQLYKTTFYAENQKERARVGHAVPSVSPGTAAKYLQKTECFCFEQQSFGGKEGKDMPVVFFVDPELPQYLDTLTLSYTFFETPQVASGSGRGADG